MKFIKTEKLDAQQKNQIRNLWNQEYPKKISLSNLAAFEEYLQNLDDKHHILLCDEHESIKGWLIYFVRDKERCFAMIVDPSVQGKGWGSNFLDEAKKINADTSAWPNSLRNVMERYPDRKRVIPGHGNLEPGAIERTLDLLSKFAG